MGNAESGCGGGSGDDDDVETESPGFAEDSPASAATGFGVGGGGGAAGSARGGRGASSLPVPTGGPPSPGVLLEQVKLREAAARISDSGIAIHESVLAGNEGVLVRWLEDRLNRGEESVNVEQFCEMLESRDAPRDECEEVGPVGSSWARPSSVWTGPGMVWICAGLDWTWTSLDLVWTSISLDLFWIWSGLDLG